MRRRLIILFVLLALLTLYTGLHAQFLWTAHPLAAWFADIGFVALMVFWQRIHRADQSDPESLRYRLLAWSGTIAMGLWATFLFFCFALDFFSLLFLIIQWIRPGSFPAWNGAALRSYSGILIGLSGVFALLGLVQAVHGPRVVRVQVPIQELPEALHGLKIALISDLHVGPTIRERYVTDVVENTLAVSPDLIAVTGDLADESVERMRLHTAPLARLQAPLGVYYVTGNHEYYWDAPGWIAQARSLGWIPLLNENRILSVKGASLAVAGITDSQGAFLPGHRPDLKRSAEGISKAGFRLLLSHRPGVYADAEALGFQLQLSGHTHGGQFFPWSLVIPFVHRYYKDLNRYRRLWVYVSSGTGYWGPPHRFLVPSEITVLELTAAPAT